VDCRGSKGFTLIELFVALLIRGTFLLLAVPSFSGLIRSNRLVTQSHNFVTAARFARTEAISRNVSVLFCARTLYVCSGQPEWSSGWIAFVDSNNNGQVDKTEILRMFDELAEGYSLQPNVTAGWLIYYPDGSVRRGGGSGGLPLMTFRLCAPDAKDGNLKEFSREIVINATGRMRLQLGREKAGAC